MQLAGIDIGTLTCRLLVADVQLPHELTEIHTDRQILRLGEGVDRHKRLSQEAMDRVVETLNAWKDVVETYSVDGIVIVATSAVRESDNRDEFLARIKYETGWDVEVLTGEEEARRTLLGLRFGLPAAVVDFWGLDIGGGSTECILARNEQSPKVISLDLGVVRLLERAFHHDPPTIYDIRNAEADIDGQLINVVQAFGQLSNIQLVGTAGTITTLAAMAQNLTKYDRTKVHNYQLTREMVNKLEHELLYRTGADRLKLPGLEPGREFVIVVGTVILRRIMQTFGCETCLVSDYGLREGMLVDLATKQC